MANPTWEDDGLGPPPPKFDELGPQVVAKPVRPNVVEFSKEDFEKVKSEDGERSREAFLRYLADQGLGAARTVAGAVSFGAAPKLTAGLEAMKNAALGQKDWDEQHYKDSNELESSYKKAADEHPALNVAGMMAVPVGKLGGLAKGIGATSKLAKVGLGAIEGATQTGALTALNRAANDTATPAGLEYGVSSAIGGTLGALAGGAGAATDALAARYAKAKAAQLAQSTAAIEKRIASAVGTLGGETQAGHRSIENLQAAAANENLPYEVRIKAMELLESPEAKELAEQVASNNMARFPSRNSAINAAKDAVSELTENKGADIAAHAENAGKDVLANEAWPRLKRQLAREMPTMIGAGLGMLAGDDAGERSMYGLVGAGLGKVAAMGQPGTAWANMMRKPAVQAWMSSAAQKPFQAAQTASQYASPVAAQSMGEKFSEYIMGNQPAQRGDEQEAQDNYRKNR